MSIPRNENFEVTFGNVDSLYMISLQNSEDLFPI